MDKTHPVASYMYKFFYQFLPEVKGCSEHSIFAYRDALKLLLCFCSEQLKKSVDQLNIEDLNEKIVLAFLHYIEIERRCSQNTRNARLAGIRTFFSFIAREESALLEQCRKIRSIPLKRCEHKTLQCLTTNEVRAIFDSIDLRSRLGIRDKTLLLILYNTGARVQEVANLNVSDIRFDSPAQVNLLGKGRKQRTCPLWPETVNGLKQYLKDRQIVKEIDQRIFLNANGSPITRFGIRHIIKEYVKKAANICPSLQTKSVGPHTFRHTTALHLIQAGNDFNMVKLWLGHAHLNTTHHYVEIDMEMKRKILNSTQPPTSAKKSKMKKWQKPHILKWLDDLSKKSQGI